MRKITLTTFMLIFCTLFLTSCSKDSISEEVTSYDQVATKKVSYDYASIEVEILEDINLYRKANGLAKLQPLTEISIEAEDHTNYMIDNGAVSHDNFQQRAAFLMTQVGAKSVSENVAYGYRSADAVVKAWLKSKGHKENIEADNTHFGISVRTDENGKHYFTNIFIRK